MRAFRFDRTAIRVDEKMRTPQGFVKCDAAISRTGVQVYRHADGSQHREYRPAEEVFHADSVASFHMAPLTLGHPSEGRVTAENVDKLGKGFVMQPYAAQDTGQVHAEALITHKDAIEAAVSGGIRELSCGYECDLDETPGEFQGEHYDAVQRNIRGNHVAILPQGRAGPAVRLKLDGADAESIEEPAPTVPKTEEHTMKFRIDGVEYEVSEQVAQAIQKLEARLAKERTDSEARIIVERDTARVDLDKQKARADAAEAARETADKARKDAEDPAKIEAKVVARAEIVGRGRAVLGTGAKFDGKSPLEIKRECLAKLAPDMKLDGKSDAYVEALFDHSWTEFEKVNPAALALTSVIAPPGTRRDDEINDGDPRTKMMRDQVKTSKEMGQPKSA